MCPDGRTVSRVQHWYLVSAGWQTRSHVIKIVYVIILYWMYIISSHDENSLFIICWTRHYSSCIEDSRTNSTWIGNPLRIWCWIHGILVSQGIPIFQSYSGLPGFLGFLFLTTNSPCSRHTEKHTNVIRCGFNQPFEYEYSLKVLVCQMFHCIWTSFASNVYNLLPHVFPRIIMCLEHWWNDTAIEVSGLKKKNPPNFQFVNGLILNSGPARWKVGG